MIRFNLTCAKGHAFDAWFASGDAYDTQQAAGLLECVVCGTSKVEKSLMAPAISRKGSSDLVRETSSDGGEALKAARELAAFMNKIRAHVEANAEYVGDNFAAEARAIHNKESEMREIYGEATLEEARDLIEEGISVAPIPGKRRKQH